jgi:hypothetical protein
MTPLKPCPFAEYDEYEEYEETQGLIDSGHLCTDGLGHEWENHRELYGEDADGNRGVFLYYERCRKCGEEI